MPTRIFDLYRKLFAMRFSVLFAALLFAGAAHAQTLPPEPDQIRLSVSVEGWVETATAKVTARVDATMRGAEAGAARAEALEALAGAAEGATWRITSFNRSQDASGLERFAIMAEARLPEAQLGGLAERADEASRPGLTARIVNVDFSPTRAEREARLAELRKELYAKIREEMEAANAIYEDREYRVRMINLLDAQPMPLAQPRMARATMAMDAESASASFVGGGSSVSEKLVMSAVVTLAAEAP